VAKFDSLLEEWDNDIDYKLQNDDGSGYLNVCEWIESFDMPFGMIMKMQNDKRNSDPNGGSIIQLNTEDVEDLQHMQENHRSKKIEESIANGVNTLFNTVSHRVGYGEINWKQFTERCLYI